MTDPRLRDILKSTFGTGPDEPSDQEKGVPYPPLQKPPAEGATVVALPPAGTVSELLHPRFADLVERRRSTRVFGDAPLTLDELSFLLWATAGVHKVVGNGYCTLRSVPSGGARHPFDTWLAVRAVEGLEHDAVYRYLPLDHSLVLERRVPDLPERAAAAALGQGFVARAAVTFYWVCVPYRAEWRYGVASYKADLLDAGHIGQNLYLAAEALGCGTCAIAAYSQKDCDELLGLDGTDEFTVYLSPVGRHRGTER